MSSHENNKNSKPLSNHRLVFGVPLEDFSPQNDINRTLKFLINEIYNSVTNGYQNVSSILSCREESIEECFTVKCDLSTSGTMEKGTKAEVLFWILRHFLGLLPLPLLSNYLDGNKFEWKEIAWNCQDIIYNRRYVNESLLDELFKIILKNIYKLPKCHFLLFNEFFQLMWSLSIWPKNNLKMKSAKSLSKYFYGALFVRPYTPGFVMEDNRKYLYLMLILIVKWNDFSVSLQGNQSLKICISQKEVEENHENHCEGINQLSSIINEEGNLLSSKVEVKNLVDCVCVKHTIIFKYKHCCCTYSSNYSKSFEETQLKSNGKKSENNLASTTKTDEINQKLDDTQNTENQSYMAETNIGSIELTSENPDTTNSPPVRPKRKPKAYLYGWKSKANEPTNLILDTTVSSNIEEPPLTPEIKPLTHCLYSLKESPVKSKNETLLELCLGDEYIYDEYECFKPETTSENVCDSVLDRNEEESISNRTEVLKKMISEIGWSYTPNITKNDLNELHLNEIESDWSMPKENYSIYFENETKEEDVSGFGEKIALAPQKPEFRRGSYILEKISSKFDLLKKFCRENLTKSISLDEVQTKIKYEKIGRTRSTSF